MKTQMAYKKTSLAIRKDLHKEAKSKAILRDVTLQDWIEEAIEEKINRERSGK